ncbi:ABC transporter substrate-binding protein [Acuticoccus sediminis]|uniref:ABC transporter substrate-binding protein n=1 Tax=Acuticoccus sediminis TaxID=2184697 RepID=A0A8B2NHM2_9HYPH|nr:ABC transporter substrate-binding protein [Acuticoccus sediminis]RAH96822.1 ABC transporter substrate-binding protein [Acuticoccus sediminis]
MITRRTLLGSAAALPMLAMPSVLRAQGAPGGTLRYVPSSNLTILDPVFTPAAVSITHGYCVFDTLYGVDSDLKPQPQMAAGHTVSDDGLTWEITLRDGLTFHDGEPVRAQDCAASLDRWSQRDAFGQALRAATEAFEAKDDKTVRIRLTRPFGPLLEAIGKPHSSPAMIMPERLASQPIAEQVTEMVGSGPFRFLADEYVSGDRVVYEKFQDYVPRSGPASWTSGGKVVHFDRLIWQIIPDEATKVAAIQAGEVDWISTVLPDLVPIIAAAPGVELFQTDPFGLMTVMRFNHLQPPFNNPEIRRAVMMAVNQLPYLQSITASDDERQECRAMFPCGMPGVEELGSDMMSPPHTLDEARKMLADAGYDGERVVILNPTDIASIHPHGLVTADLLTQLGMNVDLQDTDWGTVVQRRVSKEPVENGGWSIAHTNWPAISIANPATNATTRGIGQGGWWGWFEDAETERLVEAWLSATDPAEQQRLFNEAHQRALEMVPVVPLGQVFRTGAIRSDLQGALHGSVDMFWNVHRT